MLRIQKHRAVICGADDFIVCAWIQKVKSLKSKGRKKKHTFVPEVKNL